MVQSVKGLPGFSLEHPLSRGIAAHLCYPSTLEVEAEDQTFKDFLGHKMNSKLAWAT